MARPLLLPLRVKSLGLAIALVLAPAVAAASPADARVTAKGLKLIENEVKTLVPSHLALDPLEIVLSADACDEGPITLTLENTQLAIQLESFALIPSYGSLRIDATVDLAGTGQGTFQRVFGCFGHETCDATFALQKAHFTIDLSASIDGQGRPHISINAPVIDIKPENLALELSGCPEAELVNTLYDLVEKYALELGTSVAKNLIGTQIGHQVETILSSYMTFSGTEAFIDYRAAMTGVTFTPDGITLAADIDLTSVFPAASCVGSDPGEPGPVSGPEPDLSAGVPADLAVAVNLGVVQDAVYHVWQQGMMCVTPATLSSLNLDLSALDKLSAILPGFPEGTVWTLDANVAAPPTVTGSVADAAKLAVHATGVGLDVVATLPDRTSRSLHVDLDATITASVVVAPDENALALTIDAVKIEQMSYVDHLGLGSTGADLLHLKDSLETSILPKALGGIGKIPVTGPVFGGIQNAYVILRELRTTPSFLVVRADLFVAPAVDHDAPTTSFVQVPTKRVSPANARIVLGGSDKQDPTELLRYRISVDHTFADPTYVRSLSVGTVGASGIVHVEAYAMDLGGNLDAKGAVADIDVDGVAPELDILDDVRGKVDSLTPSIAFKATDDRSDAANIAFHLTVTEVGASAPAQNNDLEKGATSAVLFKLVAGKSYQAVLTATDEVGNATTQTMKFDVDPSAGSGCSVAGGGSGLLPLLVVLGLVIRGWASSRPRGARRRRYRG